MKSILFVSKSDMFGGLEKILVDIVNSLDHNKYKITIMTETYNHDIKDLLNKNIKYRALFKRKFKGLDRILIHFNPKLLHRIFIKKNYDLEISFQEGYPTKLVYGANNKTRKICWIHNNPDYYDFNLPFFKTKKALKKAIESYDTVVAVSRLVGLKYKKSLDLDKKINVIYNFIDSEEINKLSLEPVTDVIISNSNFTICYIGRLSEEKQIEMLVYSIIELRNVYKHIMLIIVGTGPKDNDIKDIIKKYNAYEYIKLLGYKKNPYPYISKSNALVCSSRTESFGIVLIEAMALNIPVISTKCGGPEEILCDGKYGILVNNNKSSLKKGIEDLILDKKLYEKYKYQSEECIKKFNKNNIIKQIEKIIDL